jgi:hypothetical protein
VKRGISALLAAAALVSGCGGGGDKPPDQEQVTTAVTDFAHAFGKGDGKKACELLTDSARNTFVTRIASLVGTRDCAEAIAKLPGLAGPNVTGPFQTATVSKVTVTGDNATAVLTAAGHSAQVMLQKADGDWLLTQVPGTGAASP